MGGRVVYADPPSLVQSDGGRVKITGMCASVNLGADPEQAEWPEAATIDFIVGASMVASRKFIERVGLMREDYFLYYEEVDWAARRGAMPLVVCRGAVAKHYVGTSSGSPRLNRGASAFSNYFNFRNRMRFAWRFRRASFLAIYSWSLLKIARIFLSGRTLEARAALMGMHQMAPPNEVASQVGEASSRLAFGSGRSG